MPKIKNINELRNDLLENYDALKKNPKKLAQVSELANISGKVIASLKIELEYCAMTNITPQIPFLGYSDTLALVHTPQKRLSQKAK